MRLNKFLSLSGVASRRKSDEHIFSGKVLVNGKKILTPGIQVNPSKDEIFFQGEQVFLQNKVYFMLNKPQGYVCSNKKLFPGTKLVIDFFSHLPYRLFTVGRLDKETSGLILITNDGIFADKVMHPSFGIKKEYLLKTRQDITADHLKALSEGCVIEKKLVIPNSVVKVRKGTLKIIVSEGKKHEVRILAETVGLTLLHLERLRIGSLVLGGLKLGQHRTLTEMEVEEFLKRTRRLKNK